MVGRRARWAAAFAATSVVAALTSCTSGPPPRIVTSGVAELSGMEALLWASLRADDDGCVYAETDGDRVSLVWPEGYTVSGDADSFEILDAEGEVVARSSAALDIGGGGASSTEDAWDGLDCATGRLWLVGGIRPSEAAATD